MNHEWFKNTIDLIHSKNLKNLKLFRILKIVFPYLLSVFVSVIVYLTGGTTRVYANLMYIPIALNASINTGTRSSIAHAVFSGLLIGPFMPLNIKKIIMQSDLNWIIRLIIYIFVALIISSVLNYYFNEHKDNQKKEKDLIEFENSIFYALVKSTEQKDPETGEHINRVAMYSGFIAEELQKTKKYKDYIDESYIEAIEKGTPLHDIGKMGIPDKILLKKGKLNDKEFNIIKKHPVIGADILSQIKGKHPNNKFLNISEQIIRYHHEKWDGSGYPEGLKKEEIPLSARIMAICDVYDALRTERPYKKPFSHKKAVEIIEADKETHFDPLIADIFLKNSEKINNIFINNNKESNIFQESLQF
jgi:HD-GYP domain-containing protein (c-di-GMP phosphodiesterase class II)